MKIKTTVNLSSAATRIILKKSARNGKSVLRNLSIVATKITLKNTFLKKEDPVRFRIVKNRKRFSDNCNCRVFHLFLEPAVYELCLDIRKCCKRSLSVIISEYIEKNETLIDDNYHLFYDLSTGIKELAGKIVKTITIQTVISENHREILKE